MIDRLIDSPMPSPSGFVVSASGGSSAVSPGGLPGHSDKTESGSRADAETVVNEIMNAASNSRDRSIIVPQVWLTC